MIKKLNVAITFNTMTLNIMPFIKMTVSIMVHNIMTVSNKQQ
jgi:hypothetical protein